MRMRDIEERLNTIFDGLEAMNEGMTEDVGTLREDVSQPTRLRINKAEADTTPML